MANLLSTLITGNLRTTQGYGTSDSTRILYPGGGSFVTTTSVITGAIRIKMPVFGSGMMMTCTVKVYEYSSNKSFTITFGGHRDSDNWYNIFCYFDGDGNRGDLPVRFGLDDGVNCVWIGETSNQWSYPQVFVTDVQMGYVGYSTTWLSGWSVGFVTSFGTVNRTATAFQKITTTNIGSQSVNYAASAGSAPNAGNLNTSYGVTAGAGYGLKFWGGSDTYKIHMGNSAEYHYGPVTDYSIKTNIDSNGATRGFTWGVDGGTPIAALNVGNGNMQIAGTMVSAGGTMTGTLNFTQPVGLGFANGQYIKDNGAGGLIISSGGAVNINGTSVTTNTGLTVSGPVYQGASNQGIISLLSDVVVSGTNNYFRLYLPQGYYDNRNGGTATIKVVWGMLHAGITYSQEYKLTFGTNHDPAPGYFYASEVTKTYSDQTPQSYGGYLMDQTPSVDFYHDVSGGYINFNVKGVHSYNTHRVVAVDIVGGGVGTPVLSYYGDTSPGGTALGVKDIPYATTAGALTSMNISQFTNNSGYITSVPAQSQLISPNGATVVAADSAMPSAGHSFIHTLALGPGGNDGHILGMTWASTTSVYGAQIFLDTDPNDIMAIRSRSNAGVWTSWKTVIHSGTIGSQSVNYATTSGSTSGNAATASNLAADTSTRFKLITFTGEGGDSGNGSMPSSYGIYQQGGAWTHPYPDLCIGFHTGIKIGAQSQYNGTRFYNTEAWGTEIFSVGNGDNHVRVLNNLYVTGTVTGSNLSGTNTGDQTNISGNAASATFARRIAGPERIGFDVGGDASTFYPIVIYTGAGSTVSQYSEFIIERSGYEDPGYTGIGFSTFNARFTYKPSGWGFGAVYFNLEQLTQTATMLGDYLDQYQSSQAIIWLRGATRYNIYSVYGGIGLIFTNESGTSYTMAYGTYDPISTPREKATTAKYYDSTVRYAGTIYTGSNAVIHAGNIGSQSVSYATSAGTVTNGVYTTGDQTISGTKTFAVIKGDSGSDYPHSFTNTDAGNTHWTNRGGRLLTSNGSNWAADGKDPIMALVGSTASTVRGQMIGLALHNENNTTNAFSPIIAFSALSNSSGYNSTYASIMGKKTGTGSGLDANWNKGELHFYAHGDSYVADTPTLLMTQTSSTFSGTISASNFSGTSSGTNTGDQDLSGYVTLAGTQTITGSKTFSLTINAGDSITMGGELYYGGIATNRKARAYTSGTEGSATLNYSFWTGSAWAIVSTLTSGGAANFIGNLTAYNLSGTNTGDQTNVSGNAATATNVAYSGLTGTVPTWNQNTTGNANTTSQIVFSDLKTNFPSGDGRGHSFGVNHYSMGLDAGNGAWSGPHYRDVIIGYHTGIRLGASYSGVRFYNNSPTTDANNDGNGDGGEALLMTVGGYVGTANGTDVVVNNNLIANSSLRAPIFYDSNDTAFYVDPNSSSRLRNLYVGDSGSNWVDTDGWGTQLHVSNGPHSIIRVHARTEAIETVMFSHAGGQSKVGSGTNHDFTIVRNFSGRMTFYSGYTYANGYLQAADSLRAPIFYDSQDTAYYVDPNSTSNVNAINMAGQLNMFAGAYTGTIRFGSTSYWSCGISQRDAANAEMRIWAKGGASGSIYFATNYDGELAAATLPTDGMALKNNNLGIGGFTNIEFPVSKLHVKGRITVQNGDDSGTLYGPNATWASYLYVGAASTKIDATTAQVISTNGNLHMDAGTGKIMYLNYYSNSDIHMFGSLDMRGYAISNASTITSPYFYGSGSIRLGDMWGGAGLYRPGGSMVFGIEDSDWIFSKGAVTQAYIAGADGNLWMRWAGDWLSNLLGAKQNASTAITTGNIGSQSVASATTAGSTTGNAATATNVAYSGLTGTVPTWNQNTTGNAATVGGYGVSGSVGANTVVIRDANNYIYAHYINSNVSETENPTISSFYTSNGDGWLRKSSVAHVKSQLGLGSMAYESSGTYQTVSTAINTGNIASQSVSSASRSSALDNVGYGNGNMTYYQSSGTFAGQSGWAGYFISNHGNGSNYYNQTIIMPFWGAPQYSRLQGGTFVGPYTFWSTENLNDYAPNMNQYVRTTDNVTYNSTTSPLFLVNGHSDNTKGYRIHNTSSSSVSAMFVNSSNQLVIAAGAVDQINLNKNVYVNGVALGVNFAPSATAGRIDASNDIVAFNSSDERLKENITPIVNALEKVKSLTGVEFDWKPEYKGAHGHEGHDTGIIAQQVLAVMPTAVRTNDTGYLAVRYEKLIGLLIEGMKEQQAQIDELKTKLDGLTK